jgi:hypothetical protein
VRPARPARTKTYKKWSTIMSTHNMRRRANFAPTAEADTDLPPAHKSGFFVRLIEAREAAALRHAEDYLAAQTDERLRQAFAMSEEDIRALRAGRFRLVWRR